MARQERKQKERDKLRLLLASLGVQDEEGALLARVPNTALCASLKREERLQYNFMFIYQMLVLLLALIVLALLSFAAWRIITGKAFQAVIAGAGALISGTAAGFFLKQRADSRNAHAAAQGGLKKYNCG